MSRRIQFLLSLLCLLFLADFAQTRDTTSTPDSTVKRQNAALDSAQKKIAAPKTAGADSTSFWQSLEKHPALIGLIGTLIGVIVTLITLFARQTQKAKAVAKASKQGEIEAAREAEQGKQIQAADEIERLYVNSLQAEHDTIHLYGFQSTANLKVRTLEVFVSLRFAEYGRSEKAHEMLAREDSRQLSPEDVLQRAFRKQRLLLIIGDPGSGKTTLLKYYAMCCLDAAGRQKLGLTRHLIPILLPLRKIDNPNLPFCEALSQWATRKNRPVSPATFAQWLGQRGALVMLDGLDEISDIAKRKQVCEWIDDACDTYRQSRFVVTSRYAGYRISEGIELQTDHWRADVLDLDRAQQETFLKKWFTAVYRGEIEAADLSVSEREKEIAEQAQEVSNGVLNYLDREENAGLRALAGTPVLLQIMAILWKEFHNLPPGRAALYEKCTDYLLDHRDRQKDIVPLLPADVAKIVLRPLCLWMQETLKSDEVTAAVLEKQIAKRLAEVTLGQELEKVPPAQRPRAFIENLHDRAGLLQDFGDGYIFRHKSFREYLAATHLADEVQRQPQRVQILVQNFNDGWWRETLLFSLSLPKPVIFGDFFTHFLPHAHNAGGFPPLLEHVIREARHKPVDAFAKFVLDPKPDWQQRYNALLCLRLIASEPAKALVQKVWEQEKEPRVKQKAEEILIEWKLRRPEVPSPIKEVRLRKSYRPEAKTAAEEKIAALPNSFRNPLELNAEYILIAGGKYKYSATKKGVEVPPVYFAKYPVTNKLYRRFIDYLAGKKNMQEALLVLPPKEFAQSLLAKAQSIPDFVSYLKQNPEKWSDELRPQYDDDKRFNGEDQPVVGVTWFAATAYCHWLTEMQRAEGSELSLKSIIKGKSEQSEKLVYKLPNEEEWEWAAGGGKREYPWGDDKPDETRANYEQKVGQTTPVGAYPKGATPDGLMDMAGNVWEWMENWYDKDKDARALRGGSWDVTAVVLRCVARLLYHHSVDRWDLAGFRVVCRQS